MDARERLVEVGIRDFRRAFHLPDWLPLPPTLSRIGHRFADEALEFDRIVLQDGILAGADFLLASNCQSVSFEGDPVPAEGPLMVLSNHPGMMDAMAVWQGVGRADIKTIAADRDLLRTLPGVSAHLITILEEGGSSAIRETVEHLRAGGSVLTFPAGKIQPDPALLPSMAGPEELPDLGLYRRKVPGLRVMRARVSGVISGEAFRKVGWLPFRDPMDRSWAAATLQVAFPKLREVRVKVEFTDLP